MIFSLILATYGRLSEVSDLLASLEKQTLPLSLFEIIIVDQNDKLDLDPIIAKFKETLNIKHIRSKRKGLSLNRNIGLKLARGSYICFPDDDCKYYPDTLSRVKQHFDSTSANLVLGAIRDRTTDKNIIRNWPSKNIRINRYNFFTLYSSITIFTKRNELLFDENLGVGCYFGSCEDTDYIYRLIKKTKKSLYFSDIEVWHPDPSIISISKEKNISYGLGFGAFYYKHKFDIFIARIYLISLIYHLSLSILSAFRLDYLSMSRRWDAFTSRIKGFIECKKQ